MPWLFVMALSTALACAVSSLIGGSQALSEGTPAVDVQATAEACTARCGSVNWWIITGSPQRPCAKR
jgi:hypothetical protein